MSGRCESAFRRFRPVLLAALALACAGVLAAAGQEPAELRQVTLQLKWRHQFQFAGYYAAVEQGYYRAAGIEVTIVEAQPGVEPMDQVVAGHAEFGVGTTDLLLMRDAGIPVVVLADIFQHSPLALMVLSESGIRNIHERAEGRLMIEPHSAELFAYLSDEGIALDTLQIVEHDFDTDRLIDGAVEAMSVYLTDEPYDLMSRGIPYLLFRPIESGIDFYGDNLFAMADTVEAEPELVQRFVEASLRGWQYAMAHPREIAQLIVDRYGSAKGLDRLLFEAEQMQPLVNPGVVEVGYINPGRWERIAQKYAELGFVGEGLDLDGFVYDPERMPDYGLAYRLFAALAVIAMALGALAFWYRRMNDRLQRQIEERRLAQAELESLNGQRALLLSIIGHDLRGPFGVLLNYGDMLVAQGTSIDRARLASIFQSIRDAASAAYTLLDNLLEWAALQTGRSRVVPETHSVRELASRVVELLEPLASAKGIALRVEADPAFTARGDSRMIATVLRNLVSNAVKYTRQGGVVSIAARAEGDRTCIEVADAGIGIAPDRLARLFEFEAKRPVPGTERETGSGIGLILCRDLVEANGGTLEISSELGAGTCVTLLLPAGGPTAARPAEAPAPPSPA